MKAKRYQCFGAMLDGDGVNPGESYLAGLYLDGELVEFFRAVSEDILHQLIIRHLTAGPSSRPMRLSEPLFRIRPGLVHFLDVMEHRRFYPPGMSWRINLRGLALTYGCPAKSLYCELRPDSEIDEGRQSDIGRFPDLVES